MVLIVLYYTEMTVSKTSAGIIEMNSVKVKSVHFNTKNPGARDVCAYGHFSIWSFGHLTNWSMKQMAVGSGRFLLALTRSPKLSVQDSRYNKRSVREFGWMIKGFTFICSRCRCRCSCCSLPWSELVLQWIPVSLTVGFLSVVLTT